MALDWWQRGTLQPPQLLLETAVRSGNTTLALDDAGRVVPVATSSSGITVAGASGVTVRNGGLVAPFQEVSLRKRAANEWVLAGSTT